MVHFDMPGMTSAQYEKVWEDLRAAGHANPKGLLQHVGAATENGWMVIDIWESEDLFREFGQTLRPILASNGIATMEPKVLRIHHMYSGAGADAYMM